MTTLKPAVDPAIRRAIATRTEVVFRSSGGLREGHFQLRSGRHANAYLESLAVASDPAATSLLCGFIAAPHVVGQDGVSPPKTIEVDIVAGPTPGGGILAFEIGRQLGLPAIFAEETRDPDGATRREFRRGSRIEPGQRVLLVDDVLTTGGSLLATIHAVETMGGEIVECVVLVDQSAGRSTLTSPTTGRVYALRSLWQPDLPTYDPGPSTCPGCAAGTPVHVPGSPGAA